MPMRGLWLENLDLRCRDDLPVPQPSPREALIKVRLAGICGTDLELCKGYYPFTGIPGHEFVGEVMSAPGAPQWVGQRVTGEITIACGDCDSCRRGKPKHCLRSRTLGIRDYHGTFAEYLVLPLDNLHSVPEGVPDEYAVFTEPLAAALEIQEQITVRPQEQVLVIGAGRLGLLIAKSLALTGCDLAVIVRQPRAAAILKAWGIPTMSAEDVRPMMSDLVVEVSGSPDGFNLAVQAVRPTGMVVMKSTIKSDVTFNLSPLVVNEVTLLGSRCGPFEPALALLDSRAVDPTPMIDRVYPLSQGEEAFKEAAAPGMLKVLLKM